MKIKKIILYPIAAVALISALVFGTGYWRALAVASDVNIPTLAELAPSTPELGAPVRVTLEFELPLCRKVVKAVLEPGNGAVTVGQPVIRRGAWRWSHQLWRIEGEVKSFRPGTIQPGVLTVEVSAATSTGQPELFTAVVPDFEAKPGAIAPDNQLALADAVEPNADGTWSAWHWLWLLIPLALALWFFLMRTGKTASELPPWERALLALGTLREELARHRIPLESGFSRLTDLVRNYLEKRFEIPASSRTTYEFLLDLDQKSSPLPEKQRPFLREFLLAADQVKFAKATPDITMLNNALASAEELIESTKVAPDATDGGEK